jgi:hypothetical protein
MATVNHTSQRKDFPVQFFPHKVSLAVPSHSTRNLDVNLVSSALENKLNRFRVFLGKCRSNNIDKDICDIFSGFLDSLKPEEYISGYDIDFVASTTLEDEIALDIHFTKNGLSASNLLSVLFRKHGIQLEGRLGGYYYDINEELGIEHLTIQELLATFKRYARV